jgi:D-serine deaminase-like pyridoxal phosphate-dependent protein
MQISELDTPVVVIDLDRVEANIARVQGYLDQAKLANRPHVKTHKLPLLAHKQLAAGAAGITCQKIGEAEAMAQAGCNDIFLPYNLLGEAKLARLADLARYTTLSVTADSLTVIEGLARQFAHEPKPLSVLIECDTGGRRCGVQSPAEAADLARHVARAKGLHFGGLMTYPYGPESDPFLAETKALLATDGIPVERVSGGGSPRLWHAHEWKELTEYRAGTYIYGDRSMIRYGVLSQAECAMTIHATVVSRPTADRAILDTGSKALTSDLSGLVGYGLIQEYPEAVIASLSEEHGHVDLSACNRRPVVGERVTIIPNHCCVISNLHNEIVAARGDRVEAILPVSSRGKLR